jgi:hypothetical protein
MLASTFLPPSPSLSLSLRYRVLRVLSLLLGQIKDIRGGDAIRRRLRRGASYSRVGFRSRFVCMVFESRSSELIG